ncbi:hypothetical protein LIS82_22955 [Cytobacillus solani]|uniref:hypothetical protein n=1 Tax=Cytobacillus solani TaxID=1637975 RepID=UPI00207A32DF|nr:hypothetical protein [Cytobacillus solani]USK54382.1 hypothetical protein LIS82_22955 [Cytobacillus solani]
MRVEIRKTATGTEYWDAKEKRSIFVPAGKDPDFEVTKNPKSMILGKESTDDSDQDVMNFSKMTVPELKLFAEEHKIVIPDDIKKKDDIIAFLTADDAE